MSVETATMTINEEDAALDKAGQEQVELIDVTEDPAKEAETEKSGPPPDTEAPPPPTEEKPEGKKAGFLARFKSPRRVKDKKAEEVAEDKVGVEEAAKEAEADKDLKEKKQKPMPWFVRKKKAAPEEAAAVENGGGGVEGETRPEEEVGGGKKKRSLPKPSITFDVNLLDRDDKHINDVVRINFEDILAEPDSTHSVDCAWKVTSKAFGLTQLWLYRLFTLLLGLPCGLFWGAAIALATVLHVWLARPLLRCFGIPFAWICEFLTMFLDALFTPCFKSCGAIFSNIRLQHSGTLRRIHEA